MVTEVEPEKFLEICYIPDTALVSIAFKSSLEEYQNVSILMFLLARSCRSTDRTLPCEGRNAGSIPAESTITKMLSQES